MIDRKRLHQFRCVGQYRLVQAAEANLDGAGLHPGAIEHGLEAHARPARVAHGAVRPLRAGNARLKVTARIARALVDRGELDLRQRKEIVERQRHGPVHVPVHTQPKAVHVDLVWNAGPVPANVKLIVRREYRLVEYLHGCFQQGRPGALQDKRALFGEGGGHRPLVRSPGQGKLDHCVGKRTQRRQGQCRGDGSAKKVPPGRMKSA
jgi:hypothetical protein